PASVGEALESLVAAGNVAGASTGAAPLSPPSNAVVLGNGNARATAPTLEAVPAPVNVRVVSGGDASPNGSTFLASEADV
ncbi:hypothetical protein, partial [Escherichia coli]|uniref:hypothetical protein n=1 Tax=Escherichia coli TaxID=562 RepID=UPI001BE4D7BF